MTTGLHQLKRTSKRAYRRVGRGQSSTRGKQSGRGGKGQTARAGHKIRPAMRDIIKKIPKRRGYGKNRGRTYVPHLTPVALSLEKLNKLFESGAEVSVQAFRDRNMVSARKPRLFKIVGPSTSFGASGLTKKFTIKDIAVSASARAAIEKAGGTVLDFVSAADAQGTRIKSSKIANKIADAEVKPAHTEPARSGEKADVEAKKE
ncbi:MAG: uL15 family ribosomal protein [bacterium]|nr:uL15 family ribosomal protein [bacterium]